MTDRTPPAPSPVKCPVCGTPVATPDANATATTEAPATFPFCSSRCRQVDLGRWMNESYVVSRPIEQADLDALDER